MGEPDVAIDPDLEVAYVSGQGRPTWPGLLADFAARSEVVAASPEMRTGLAYGPHPRQRFDVVPAIGAARGSLVYLHAGYWQMRDRTPFRFLAPRFAAQGFDVILADYPLAPEATVAEITQAVRALVPAVRAEAAARYGAALPIVATGHSAGGHLAMELALTDPSVWGLDAGPIAAVVALSGVFDLEPLIATSLNRKLGLTPASARAASPVWRATGARVPALVVVGGGETPAFVAQSRRMVAAWAAGGARAELAIVDGADHFSLLAELATPGSAIAGRVAAFLAEV